MPLHRWQPLRSPVPTQREGRKAADFSLGVAESSTGAQIGALRSFCLLRTRQQNTQPLYMGPCFLMLVDAFNTVGLRSHLGARVTHAAARGGHGRRQAWAPGPQGRHSGAPCSTGRARRLKGRCRRRSIRPPGSWVVRSSKLSGGGWDRRPWRRLARAGSALTGAGPASAEPPRAAQSRPEPPRAAERAVRRCERCVRRLDKAWSRRHPVSPGRSARSPSLTGCGAS